MIAVLACAAAVLAASLLIGRALLLLLAWPAPHWLAGATGFAALVVLAPFLIRLPGRGTTAAFILLAVTALAASRCWKLRADEPVRGEAPPDSPRVHAAGASDGASPRPVPASLIPGALVVAATLLLGLSPFLFNERVGVLGEGIYTNDHAAQLYWADWLQRGFGPQPSAVQFGYPVGPQAVAAAVGEIPGVDLVDAFNGLLLAIPALTALAALSVLGGLEPRRRVLVAVLAGLPYLAASFLAQSAFKETAMALFLLAFVCALQGVGPGRVALWRQMAPLGLLLAAASVLTFSVPGLVWFAIVLGVWLAFEVASGRSPVDLRTMLDAVRRHRAVVAGSGIVLVAAAVALFGPASSFIEKIGDVQESAGRLSSPVFPGEALGIWPQGDFRVSRGDVAGSLFATGVAALAVLAAVVVVIRRREWALFAGVIAGGAVYAASRPLAEIHVEAKALAIMSPLVVLVALRALLSPADAGEAAAEGEAASRSLLTRPEGRGAAIARQTLGALVALAMLGSTLLALRAAPVGFDERQRGLEELAAQVEGESVAFLGVDRFAGYYLRDTLMRAPAGYVPNEIASRPEKPWQQGDPADFDTLDPGKLDKFDYAIAPAVAYASAPPKNFERIAEAGDYALWRRHGETPRSRVLEGEAGRPGVELPPCTADRSAEAGARPALASVFSAPPLLAGSGEWSGAEPAEDSAGGQESAFLAPGAAAVRIRPPRPGEYELSLQYHSQVPLEVLADGELVGALPPSLEGMYLDGAGQGAFWPVGTFALERPRGVRIEVRAAAPSGLQDALGVQRRVWLGELAATLARDPVNRTTQVECGSYVDHFRFLRGGR